MKLANLRRAAYALALLTGAAALIDQIVWQRYLTRLLGGDALATAIVLGVFLGGLSLGYLVCGRLTERVARPLVAYGAIEAAIGAWGLAFPLLFRAVDAATAGWSFTPRAGLLLQGVLASLVLIGPPTIGMGGTVPLLTRGLAASLEEATAVNARTYAWNTAGACLGALGAGFALIELLGLPGTLRAAALLNLAAAAFFVFTGRARRLPAADRVPPPDPASRGSRAATAGVALLGGFAFMTLESLIVRYTRLSIGASSHALALVVAACVLAIAAGAALVARRRTISPAALVTNQAVGAAGLMLLFVTLDKWPWGAHLLRLRFGTGAADFAGYHLAVLVVLTALVIVPAGAMGATLPLAFHARKSRLDRTGRDAGVLLAWSAAGNLLGGLVGGFALLVWLGNAEVFLVAVVVQAVSAVLAALAAGAARRVAWTALVAALAFSLAAPFHDPLRFAVGTFRLREPLEYSYTGPGVFYERFHQGRTVLAYRDDPEGTFAVIENPRLIDALRRRFPNLKRTIAGNPAALGEQGPPPRAILINGKTDSSTFYDRETLRLAAHLPALLAARRDRALVIGLGTGVTAGELALYPDAGAIEVAEIAPGIVELLPLFGESTGEVQRDPRLAIRTGDAFRIVRREQRTWDLVISQPSNPWTSGVDQLYSLEFVAAVRRHLAADGVFVQWVQAYATTPAITALAVNTVRAEFPHVRIFRAGADDLVVASPAPIDPPRLRRAGELLRDNDRVRASLAEIGIDGMDDLLTRERPEALARAVELAGLGLETLDRPRIHARAYLAFFRGEDRD